MGGLGAYLFPWGVLVAHPWGVIANPWSRVVIFSHSIHLLSSFVTSRHHMRARVNQRDPNTGPDLLYTPFVNMKLCKRRGCN